MSSKVGWLVEGRVIFVETENEVSIDELQDINNFIAELMEQSDAPLVHVIVYNHAAKIPLNVIQLQNVSRPVQGHPRNGWNIFVSASNGLVDFAMNAVSQVFKTRWRQVSSFEEALAFLQSVDQSLPALPLNPEPDVLRSFN